MRRRIATLAMAAVAFLGTGGALVADPAQAVTTTYGPFPFYVNGTSNCIVTHGPGNQLTDSNTGSCANIKLTLRVSNDTYWFTDGNGNCLRANSADEVVVESGSCNPNDTAELWIQTAGGNPDSCSNYTDQCRFENQKQGKWLMVTGPSPGDKIWVGFGGLNNWVL